MSKSWTDEEIQAASKVMVKEGHMSYEQFCECLELQKEKESMEKVAAYIEENNIPKPVQLGIRLDKLVQDRNRQGNQVRYFRFFLNGKDVTEMITDALGNAANISKGMKTRGDLIVHGSGMDMFMVAQSKVYSKFYQNGYKDLFDNQFYHFIEKRKVQ